MSDPHLPSDTKLGDLREEAILAINTKRKPIITGKELLALVRCAEIVHTDYLLLSAEQQMIAAEVLREFDL